MTSLDAPRGRIDLRGVPAEFRYIEDGDYWQVAADDRVVAVLRRDERGWYKSGDPDVNARFEDPETLARLVERGAR